MSKMITDTNVHNVQSWAISKVKPLKSSDAKTFYIRDIVITNTDGDDVRITMFSDDFESLFLLNKSD